jgi:hypothetical protein
MTIPAAHQDALIAYLADQTKALNYSEICVGMRHAHPEVHMTIYLVKKLWKEGRIEKMGLDSWRAMLPRQATMGDGSPTCGTVIEDAAIVEGEP